MEPISVTTRRVVAARQLIWRDVQAGFKIVVGRTVAFVGVLALALAVVLATRPELRETAVAMLSTGPALVADTDETDTLAATDPENGDNPAALRGANLGPLGGVRTAAGLPKDQRAATHFLARKYHLAPDAIAFVVNEAFNAGKHFQVDPLLILAIMSVESSLNPFAQSTVGAQGLMQVMTTVHADRFEEFGGPHAALNPVANIRVGAEILKELIDRHGSIEAGLKAYVGAAYMNDDAGYGARVLVERARLESAVTGRPMNIGPGLPDSDGDTATGTHAEVIAPVASAKLAS